MKKIKSISNVGILVLTESEISLSLSKSSLCGLVMHPYEFMISPFLICVKEKAFSVVLFGLAMAGLILSSSAEVSNHGIAYE